MSYLLFTSKVNSSFAYAVVKPIAMN